MWALSLLTLAVAASLFDGVHTWSVAQIHTVSLHGRHIAAVHSAVRLRTCPGVCSPRPIFTPPVRSRAFSMAPLGGLAKNVDEHTLSQEPGAALMAKLGELADQDKRRAMLRENFQQCDEAAMAYLGAKLQSGERGNWQALLVDLQELMQERLEAGKELLMNLLASGEINVLDRKIVEKVNNGECDPSFLNVLQINLQDAEAKAAEDDPQRLQVLVHIYTRVQEELEKKAKPAVGLLHKLLRMIDEPEIRTNLLEHNLKPKPEAERAMLVIDGKLTLEAGSLVRPMDLSQAIVNYMNRVRGIDQAIANLMNRDRGIKQLEAGFTENDVAQTFEDCRVIAKEARMQVDRFYSKEDLDQFTESLTPVFEPIMGTLANYRRPQ